MKIQSHRAVLPISSADPIPPGTTAIVIASPTRSIFRPERLLISPHSFRLSRARLLWTWPLIAIGTVLWLAHRALAWLLRVDLAAPRERPEYLTDAEITELGALDASIEEWDSLADTDVYYDADDRPYRLVPIPLNLRERFLAPIGRAARRLVDIRIDWQRRQLGRLNILDITIGANSRLAKGCLPGDMFATQAIDTFVDFKPCQVGQDIAITIENGSRQDCHLMMSLVGTETEPSA